MPDAAERLSQSLARYQALVVGGLAFLVVFAVTVMGVMLWQAASIGKQSAKLENVAEETHNVLCAQFEQNIVANREARKLLSDSPGGLLDPRGNIVISADLIQRGIAQRQEAIDAMNGAGLSC